MIRELLLLSFIGSSLAAVAMYPVKAGERLTLDLGGNIKTWGRTRSSGEKEFIMHCGPTEKNIRCAQFVTESGKVLSPPTSAVVHSNGTLVIDPVVSSDAGGYFSMDEPERITQNADGTYWATPRSLITVIVN